ncbi:MAG: hypothetical protein QF486_06200 [Candidatus Woesearchaeota archaeon]|jgi:hypothetical protein|nr:hypothetical protein [Candidatus Woesearchaeota archaeon]MDP7180885.1 hypothetical protein [Candidatus Woesearchaeota archaeon]MDP7199177.1 hypothetical protein [Candidatus Woesearchaeota archaeon]MDP7467560.1 hypothetical protein [Candidatus Woesearchaeota archaeon]MDP7647042.1 hypothetical protein [Candidatus Woesearchaeota archaeon]
MKGVFFATIVFFILLGALVALMVLLYSAGQGINALGDVGAKGVAVVRANQEATSLQLRAQRIGVQATHQALEDLSLLTPTRTRVLVSECGEDPGEVVWYKNGVCAPSTKRILTQLQKDIAQRIKAYLPREEDRFISRDFDISIIPQNKGMRVIGVPHRVALLPVNVDGSLNNKAVATVAADMSFDVEIAYNIQEILDIVTNMERIDACVQEDDPECLSNVAASLFKRSDSTDEVAFLEYTPNEISIPGLRSRPLRFAIVSVQQ